MADFAKRTTKRATEHRSDSPDYANYFAMWQKYYFQEEHATITPSCLIGFPIGNLAYSCIFSFDVDSFHLLFLDLD
eukprot:gene8784-1159_t